MCYDGYLMNTNSIPAHLLGSLHKFTYDLHDSAKQASLFPLHFHEVLF